MSNRASLILGLLCTLLLSSCSLTESTTSNSILKLPPCAGNSTLFSGPLDALPAVYHGNVENVINAHVQLWESVTSTPFQCTATSFNAMLRPTAALRSLASQVPEWGPSRGQELSEADLSAVLLEHLRVYECTLHQREQFLYGFIFDEQAIAETETGGLEVQIIDRNDLTEESSRQKELIHRELTTSRPALERTLALMGGLDRMRPLIVEIECLKRASLDVRNTLGLIAEAASCMPKAWDTRGSLRDLSDN